MRGLYLDECYWSRLSGCLRLKMSWKGLFLVTVSNIFTTAVEVFNWVKCSALMVTVGMVLKFLVTVWFEVHFDFPVVNPSDPYISMLILHTVLYTFLKVLIRRICLAIKSFFSWRSFPLFSWPECVIQGCYCEGKLDADHSKRSKG